MLFKKKGKIRKLENERLVTQIESLKSKWVSQNELVRKSVDPSEEVMLNVKLTEAKYLFLLKEARKRNTSMGKS